MNKGTKEEAQFQEQLKRNSDRVINELQEDKYADLRAAIKKNFAKIKQVAQTKSPRIATEEIESNWETDEFQFVVDVVKEIKNGNLTEDQL